VTKARARILVAEDNAVNQRLVVSILRNKHYDVEVVTNGVRALVGAASRLTCCLFEEDPYV